MKKGPLAWYLIFSLYQTLSCMELVHDFLTVPLTFNNVLAVIVESWRSLWRVHRSSTKTYKTDVASALWVEERC